MCAFAAALLRTLKVRNDGRFDLAKINAFRPSAPAVPPLRLSPRRRTIKVRVVRSQAWGDRRHHRGVAGSSEPPTLAPPAAAAARLFRMRIRGIYHKATSNRTV
jgi:hypothetical protein